MRLVPTESEILECLRSVKLPSDQTDLVAAGRVSGIQARIGQVSCRVRIEPGYPDPAWLEQTIQTALMGLAGVRKADVALFAPPPSTSARPSRASVAADPKAMLRPPADAVRPGHVKRVIAIASGKGGVGKSTLAINLACALSAKGLSVGVMDADIYGPSIPTLLGIHDKPEYRDGKLQPLLAHGLKVMSIGFISEPGSAMIWRGPMASSAARQMSQGVAWGSEDQPLDVLVLDLPPGTGDIHLTLIQSVTIDGVVVVSTPQEVALIDARRAVDMFNKIDVPVLGLVENMSGLPDPAGGAPIPIFGQGGVRKEAMRLGLPLLAEILIDPELGRSGDAGTPLMAVPDTGHPDVRRAFEAIAQAVTTP